MDNIAIESLTKGEEDAFALAEAAILLEHARHTGGAELTAALENNLQLWVAIRTLVERPDSIIPVEIRENLVKLSQFVAQKTFEVGKSPRPATLDSLITINLHIAEGLLEGIVSQRIRDRAYYLWELDGRQHGRDQDHWAQAEREIRNAAEYRDAVQKMEKLMSNVPAKKKAPAKAPAKPAAKAPAKAPVKAAAPAPAKKPVVAAKPAAKAPVKAPIKAPSKPAAKKR
jgi:flagellar biosynthesis regulator FlaF